VIDPKKLGGKPVPVDLDKYEVEFYKRVNGEVERIRKIVNDGDRVKCLLELRVKNGKEPSAYENINQYPHEWACIKALEYLQRKHPGPALKWRWNPRTGRGLDITAADDGGIIVAAECTTVTKPYKSLIERIRFAVDKLCGTGAPKTYLFVLNEEVEAEVKNIVSTTGVIVRRISVANEQSRR
jgi:hypothetical protein